MHFLAHYYTELPANNPLFVAGLTMPDLTPRFTRVYNTFIVKQTAPENEGLKQIYRGIVQHFGADKRFHTSPLFAEHVSLATKAFLKVGLSRERLRLSVIAHLAVEMLIDRQIVLEKSEVCTAYYSLLEKADESILSSYFDLFVLENEKQNFFRSFHFYKQRRFLFLFNKIENIVFGLNRVYGLVAKTEFTETEKQNFLKALHNIDGILRYSWQQILNP